MGNCCDCLRGSSEEQEYTPIETTEITQPRSGGRSGVVGEKIGISNYQSIIDRASSDFISSKYRAKSDALAISGNQEAVGLVRSKLNQAELSPDVAVSPPNTGLNIDALMRLKLGGGKERGNSHAQDADVNGNNSVVNSKRNTEPQSVISLLHVEPVVKTQNYANMEGTANDIALIMTQKVFDKDVDTHNATMAESAGSGVGTGSSSTSSSSSSIENGTERTGAGVVNETTTGGSSSSIAAPPSTGGADTTIPTARTAAAGAGNVDRSGSGSSSGQDAAVGAMGATATASTTSSSTAVSSSSSVAGGATVAEVVGPSAVVSFKPIDMKLQPQ
eukprot:CAMPEP_0174969714 /NCGR_PEP_ID=MMETSP0004_2-20121128/8933_1 /TAXON_ID=420556 /ORGANISM="Ochromonas sp., Strain CCMP1393" /LENGTH=331 /DNA_ID=CAMNT_0016219269 /DNA_START=99 /DNA_END=1094 /DNA_ORIENTATION=+